MKYAEMKVIEKGLIFKSAGGLTIRTSGTTRYIPSRKVYVHEVEIIEGDGEGNRYLYNLDTAELLSEYSAAA